MNFDFSDEQKQLRDSARKFLAEKCPPKAVRVVIDGKAPYDRDLWKWAFSASRFRKIMAGLARAIWNFV
jgi:alkylation response protein AidB-like acyl-CoA dehydrogenase